MSSAESSDDDDDDDRRRSTAGCMLSSNDVRYLSSSSSSSSSVHTQRLIYAARWCKRGLSPSCGVHPSVRLSASFVDCVENNKRIFKKFFAVGLPHHSSFAVPNIMAIFRRGSPPLSGASNARRHKKSRFSTNISLYLRIDTRQIHSYYGRRIENRTQAFEWYSLGAVLYSPSIVTMALSGINSEIKRDTGRKNGEIQIVSMEY